MTIFIYLAVLLFLVILSGLFSSSETAFTSLTIIQIEEIKNRRDLSSKLVTKLTKKPEKLLTTILFGNNLVNIAATAIASKATINYFQENSDTMLTVTTIILTFVILIFSEVTPKQIALNHNELIARMSAPALLLLTWIFSPFVVIISFISNILTRITSLGKKSKPISLQGILHMVNIAENIGVVEEYETDMVKNVFRLNDIPVSSIMTHRTEVFSLNRDMTIEEARKQLYRVKFSRIPIFQDENESITGFVMHKDILKAKHKEAKLKEIEFKPVFVSETKKVNDLFGMFKIKKQKLAVVLDEYGGLAGIVTQEDVIEEIFGELYDESEERETDRLVQINVNTFSVKGDMPTDIFNQEFSENLEYTRYSQTIAGFLAENLDKIPEVNDTFQISSGRLRVDKVEKNHVTSVLYTQN